MPRLPGICQECGAIYPSPLRAGASGQAPAFDVPARCPSCGGSGRIPAEILDRIGSVLTTARGLAGRPEALEELRSLVREATPEAGRELTAEEEEIRRARLRGRVESAVPAGTDLVDGLPGLGPGQAEAFLRLLEIAVEMDHGGQAEGTAAGRLLEEAYRRHGPEGTTGPGRGEDDPADRIRVRLRSTGRNDPCPCGSGEKYKDCHWLDDLRETR